VKNPFSAIFLTSLLLLTTTHHLNITVYQTEKYLALALFLGALLLFRFKKYKASYIFITLALSLLLTTHFIKQKQSFFQHQQLSLPSGQYIHIQGTLSTFPEIRHDHSIIFLNTQSFEYNKKKIDESVNVRIKVNGNLKDFYKGDLISINANVYRPSFNRNFFPNPYENYQLVHKNHFNGYCKSARLVTRIKNAPFFWHLIGSWRNKIREVIDKYSHPKRGVFLLAVLIGERGQLTQNQEEELLNAGVFHLLAISGAHIGIIAFLCLGIFKFLSVSLRNRYMITAVILILFLMLSGFKISAERAVLMALLIFIARILALDIEIFNIISFSGFLMLTINPAQFLDAGFILTYTLTAAIVLGRRIFLPLLEKWDFLTKKPFQLGELLSANLSASLLALPLSLFFFKRYSFAGIISGILLIPLTAVITGLGLLLIPLAPLSSFLSKLLLSIMDIPLRLFFYITAFFSRMINVSIYRASPPLLLILLILILFFLISTGKTRLQKTVPSILFLLLLLFISLKLFFYSPETLEVFYLDVGQGDAQVAVFPGGDALLIDGGGSYFSDFQVGKNILLPFLLQKRIKIRWIAVSHYHPDHAYGIAEVIRVLQPQELWISSETPQELGYKRLFQAIPPSTEIRRAEPGAGFLKKFRQYDIELLYPERFIKANRSHNNHSQVIKITGPHHSFLFTGDIEKEVEEVLSAGKCPQLRADVIKVPHHGSASSSGIDFLKCVNPQLAIFSYGRNNRFRFPHKKVLKTYQTLGIDYLTTARSGGIRLVSLPGKIKIDTSQ